MDGSTTSAMHPSLGRSYTPFLLDDSSEAEVDTSSLRKDLRKDSGDSDSHPIDSKHPSRASIEYLLVWYHALIRPLLLI